MILSFHQAHGACNIHSRFSFERASQYTRHKQMTQRVTRKLYARNPKLWLAKCQTTTDDPKSFVKTDGQDQGHRSALKQSLPDDNKPSEHHVSIVPGACDENCPGSWLDRSYAHFVMETSRFNLVYESTEAF